MKASTMLKTVSVAALLAVSAGALAQNPNYAQEDNDKGFYAGGGFGRYNVEIDNPGDVADTIGDFDSDDTAWKIFGGYRFNKYLSVEAGYVDLGAPSDEFSSAGSSGDYSVSLSGFAPYVIGTLPVGPVELFAKAGYLFYDLEINADLDDLGGDVFQTDDSGEDFVYGFGIGATFLQRLNVRAEYEFIDVDDTETSNALWLTASWRF